MVPLAIQEPVVEGVEERRYRHASLHHLFDPGGGRKLAPFYADVVFQAAIARCADLAHARSALFLHVIFGSLMTCTHQLRIRVIGATP